MSSHARTTKARLWILAAAGSLACAAAYGHGGDDDHAAGRPGDPAKVTRTVNVAMTDAMRFEPAEFAFRKGETVRFVVRNRGRVDHEMVLGTAADLRRHADQMRAMPGMDHAEPNMVRVKPGERAELVWTFDRPGRLEIGCLVPGHYEAGMKGKVVVK